jgi:hypothetical protein
MQTITSITVDNVETIPGPGAHSLQRLTFLHMLALIVLVSLATFLGANEASADAQAQDGKTEVALQRLGEPCFRPVDFHLFSASTADLAGLLNGTNGVLPEPAHKLHPDLFIGPGTMPHAPPYNKELKDGLERLGIPDQKRFSPAEFSLPNAVFFSFMVVAQDREGCPKGSSPDFAEGPIIPNLLFPATPEPDSVLLSRTTFFRNGHVFDPAFIFDLKRLDKVDPAFPVDGWSHIPIFLIEAAEFGPGGEVEGNYKIHSVLLDHAGNGWDITTRFKIK